eukprot:Nk52_evm1s221 gene=Nk52_evmTU1s221
MADASNKRDRARQYQAKRQAKYSGKEKHTSSRKRGHAARGTTTSHNSSDDPSQPPVQQQIRYGALDSPLNTSEEVRDWEGIGCWGEKEREELYFLTRGEDEEEGVGGGGAAGAGMLTLEEACNSRSEIGAGLGTTEAGIHITIGETHPEQKILRVTHYGQRLCVDVDWLETVLGSSCIAAPAGEEKKRSNKGKGGVGEAQTGDFLDRDFLQLALGEGEEERKEGDVETKREESEGEDEEDMDQWVDSLLA